MNPQIWNERYSNNETVYGKEPNAFFKLFIDLHKPGSILLPAEGEGRNAIYAAKKGWQVDAFDYSTVAKEKALKNAERENVIINYQEKAIENFVADKQYDAVALIYIHLPQPVRPLFHEQVYNALKPGGFLILEAFSTEQINYNSGGPRDISMLYTAPMLCKDFQLLHILNCEQKIVHHNEGPFHQGAASILRLIGQKM
jgi:2-polyprenyl-3-methyl-5-hydroxy-6-metoxy-1,4-benzoquinol methylase